jgi:putative DNA primase/helicase
MSTKYLHKDVADRLPLELKDCTQWITWNAGQPDTNGKFKKFPKGKDGSGDEWQKPHQWSTFADVIADAKKHNRAGVGIVLPAQLSDGSFLVALDFDDVDIERATDNPRFDEIQQIYEDLHRPYTEESPSRKGLRMFLRTSSPIAQVSKINPLGGKDEFFCKSSKWATVTGMHIGGSGIPNETDKLNQLAQSWGARKVPPNNTAQTQSSPHVPVAHHPYARLTDSSLVTVLSRIDCFDEPTWHSVSNSLARSYGETGRDYFERFSKGDFWTKLYSNFDVAEVNEKYDRALSELTSRPDGYGVLHLVELAGLNVVDVEFEDQQQCVEMVAGGCTKTQAISKVISFPAIGLNKKPQQVSENLLVVLGANSITARYNQITKRPELLVPGLQCVKDESDNTSLTVSTDLAIKAGMTANRVPELLDAIAAQNPYCPVQTYIDSKPWDGVSRFAQFTGQIVCANPTFTALLWRKWLIQAVGAVYEPCGISNAGVIVLTGAQNIGKTTFFRALTAGVSGVFLEGQTLNPADKDSVLTAVSHWIVELGELDATFKKADIAQLKAFVTKTSDKVRRPYARKDSSFPRRTVFAGTVNDFQFLHDITGNRRFWPIAVDAITLDPSLDFQQFWAEVKTWYYSGEKWYLNNQELDTLNQYSEQFMVNDPDIEALLSKYPFIGCTQWTAELMKEICRKAYIDNPTKAQTMKLASAIRKYNGGQKPLNSNQGGRHFVPDLDAIKAATATTQSSPPSAVVPVTPVAPVPKLS